MSANQQILFGGGNGGRGEQVYTTPGTYTWVAPAGVTKVSVVAVGPGRKQANAGSGGGLGYKNNYSVTPGSSYAVVVGSATGCNSSYFCAITVVRGLGGVIGGTYVGDGGGNGGSANYGGGGAGGYSGNGGGPGSAGSGGGGGGGSVKSGCALVCCVLVPFAYGGAGGGVGIYGQGSNGAAGTVSCSTAGGGGGGSGGANGGDSTSWCTPGSGGNYGGGAGSGLLNSCQWTGNSGNGAVRIVWPGCARTFPSTDVA